MTPCPVEPGGMYEWLHHRASCSRRWVPNKEREEGGHWLLGNNTKDDLYDGDLYLVLATVMNRDWGEQDEDVYLALVLANGRVSWHVCRWKERSRWGRLDDYEIDSNAVLTRSPAI